ncbi:MAG: hypothetical protein H7Y38_15985, partial [Armatimonadetes bacterium]|nr:hypothetical protein [Armatimonadota bacterium]
MTRFLPANFTSSFPLAAITLAALLLPTGCVLAQVPAKKATPKTKVANKFAPDAAKSGVPQWIPMPLLTPAQKKAGIFPGGEGCQWPRGFVVSDADPNLMILPIDVGGLYRSLDRGKTWEQASVGWDARGCNDVAFDPRNASRMIGLAGNSGNWDAQWGPSPHGIYVSSNKAASWKHVVGLTERIGHAAAYDATSFDAKLGYCTVAYVASPTAGLLRTSDGGESWNAVSDLPAGGMIDDGTPMLLRVHPKTGAIYLGLKDGLHVSKDGGKTFEKKQDGAIFGIALQPKSPDTMYVCGDAGLLKSTDAGTTFVALPAKGMDRFADNKAIRNVAVSAADPLRLSAWVSGDNWKWGRYASHDGGKTFFESKFLKTTDPMPMNVRQGYYLWDPKDANIVYSLGGDCVTRSVDGGRTFNWYNNGYNGVMMGGGMNFSVHAPKTVFLAFQDYNSAATNDGGATWNYFDSSGKGWVRQLRSAKGIKFREVWVQHAEDSVTAGVVSIHFFPIGSAEKSIVALT